MLLPLVETGQYTSAQLGAAAADLGLLRSGGRTGVCWDNAAAETFWSTLKTEFYDRRRWHTKAKARLAVGAWIEGRYNRQRRHSALSMISPVRFERQPPPDRLSTRRGEAQLAAGWM